MLPGVHDSSGSCQKEFDQLHHRCRSFRSALGQHWLLYSPLLPLSSALQVSNAPDLNAVVYAPMASRKPSELNATAFTSPLWRTSSSCFPLAALQDPGAINPVRAENLVRGCDLRSCLLGVWP